MPIVLHTFTCRACGETSSATRPAATCSNACRASEYRRRKREREAAARAAISAGLNGDASALALGLSAVLRG